MCFSVCFIPSRYLTVGRHRRFGLNYAITVGLRGSAAQIRAASSLSARLSSGRLQQRLNRERDDETKRLGGGVKGGAEVAVSYKIVIHPLYDDIILCLFKLICMLYKKSNLIMILDRFNANY